MSTARIEAGRVRRQRTRSHMVRVAATLLGHEHGCVPKIEDFCTKASVSRGSFYNHFASTDELCSAVSEDLGHALYEGVSCIVDQIPDPVLRLASGCRYYLYLPTVDPAWSWALVNTSLRAPSFGIDVNSTIYRLISSARDSGKLSVESTELGVDIVTGIGIFAARSLLLRRAHADYPERTTRATLIALGLPHAEAQEAVSCPLPPIEFAAFRPF